MSVGRRRRRPRGQLHPPPCGGIAHYETEIIPTLVAAAVEKEAIAGVHLDDALVFVWVQVREGRVERGRGAVDAGEVVVDPIGDDGHVEEAGEGLGELLAVGGVGDEVAPWHGDALEAVEGSDREAGEDLQDDVVGEQAGRPHHRPLLH